MTTVINKSPFLKTSIEFPEEVKELSYQVNLSYVDIANAVNERMIGLFPTFRPALTGNSYYLVNNKKQQSFRQVYTFTTTASINHNIDLTNIYGFAQMYGTYTDGVNWYGLIAGSNVAIAGQISFYITSTQIVFLLGGGQPAVTKGLIILEWISFG